MSTLQTKITKVNEIITVYDQIDYTLCKQNQKQTLIGARSWSNVLVDSDFRIVATKLDVQLSKTYPKTIKTNFQNRLIQIYFEMIQLEMNINNN